jgi:hypothetical protein
MLAGAVVVGDAIASASMRNDLVAAELRKDMASLEDKLGEQARNLESKLGEQARSLEGKLGEQARGLEGKLGEQVRGLEGKLDEQVRGLEGKLGEKAAGLEHTLEAKLAGVTAGAADKAEAATLRVLREYRIAVTKGRPASDHQPKRPTFLLHFLSPKPSCCRERRRERHRERRHEG